VSGAYETQCATPTGLPRRMAERRARNATWRIRSTHGTARNYDMRWPAQLPGDGTSQICNHKRSCHLRLKGDLYGDGICDTANCVVVVAMSSGRNRALSKNHHLMSHFRYSIFYTIFSILCPVEGGVLLDMSLGSWCNEDKLAPLVSKSARTASVSTSDGF